MLVMLQKKGHTVGSRFGTNGLGGQGCQFLGCDGVSHNSSTMK
jgi:hypothetical protein